jgi:GT2 family glycosyltransferase
MSPRFQTPSVSVVIGSLNRRWHLKRAVESIRAELPFPETEIVVVDGGSRDGALRWLTGRRDVLTIVQHNQGEWEGRAVPRRSWGSFMNLGFRAASAPFICMISDDCLVVPDAIPNGLERFGDEAVGAVAFYWRNWPEQERYWVGRTFGNTLFVNHGLFRREALESIGFADEETFGFYHGDGDLALRLAASGWSCVDSPTSFIEHFSHANLALRAKNLEVQKKDWEAYEDRWGHLGAPDRDWDELAHTDPHRTAQRFWGRRARLRAGVSRVRARLTPVATREGPP